MSGVRLAEQSDLARIARTATRAFANDPLLRWFFPAEDAYAAAAPEAFGSIARTSIGLGCTYVTADAVAVGIYFPPNPEGGHTTGADDAPPPEEEPAAGGLPPEMAARFEAFHMAQLQHTPPEAHWYLNVLATHPDWQRQGLGSAIIAPVAERARAEGLPLYLETQTAANVAYYGHLGFAVRSEWDLAPDGPHMWGMVLAP